MRDTLPFMERKYLRRLRNGPVYESERHFHAARPILQRMAAKGLVERIETDTEGWCWELTDAGREHPDA
jgi:hypothetical protein